MNTGQARGEAFFFGNEEQRTKTATLIWRSRSMQRKYGSLACCSGHDIWAQREGGAWRQLHGDLAEEVLNQD